MADLLCSFLPLFLPPKRYFSSAFHSHSSRITRIKSRSPHLPLLFKSSPFATSAADIDLISTHEHSDGTFLFCFGDPSEIVKNVETEEAKVVKEEIEEEDTNGSSMVKVTEGEDESKVTTSGLIEATDDSIVSSSNTLVAVESESEVSEKLVVETEVSSPDLDVEPIRLNEEHKDQSGETSIPDESSEIENNIAEVSYGEPLEETSKVTRTSEEIEIASIGVVEECPNEEDVDSPAEASILDESSEVVDSATMVALLEKEDGISSADIDPDKNAKVEEGLDGDYEDTPVDVSAVVSVEKETDDDTSTSDIEIGPTGNVEEGINEEYEDSAVDITSAPDNTTAALSEKETADITLAPDSDLEETGNEDRGLDEILEETSSLEKRPEVESCITAQELPEKETVDIATAPDIDIEYTGSEERGLDGVLEEPSSVEKRPEVENCITSQELLEKESVDITSAPDMDIDYTAKVQEGLDEVLDEPSSVEKRPDVETHITGQELLEKESIDVTSAPDMDIEDTAKVQQGLDEGLDKQSLVEKIPEVEIHITAQELLEKETADITSAPDIDVEYAGNVEQGLDEVLEKPSPVERRPEVEYHISAQELSEKETADITFVPETVSVEQGLDEVLDEPSSVEKRPEVENTAQELSEKETAEIASMPDIDKEYTDNVEQDQDEVLEEPCSVEMRPEVANSISAQELLENETAEATTLVAFNIEPMVTVLDTDAGQGCLGTAGTPNVVPISEVQNAETAIYDETISDGRESFDNTLVSLSSQSEPVMNLYKETEAPNLRAEVQNLATEESTEIDMNNIEAIEMQNVPSNNNNNDVYGAEEDSPTIEPAMTLSQGSVEQASGSESGMPDETVGYVSEKDIQLLTVSPQLEADSMLEEETGSETVEELKEDDTNQIVGGDLADASVHEVTVPESTITSQEILMTNFVLSSGAALLPHPSKVLTGGEDAYFIADETWLGVADGVSQWTLEGTSPGVYAQELIRNCEKLISECSDNSINNPIELLNLSVAQSHSPGSSTVLIARFDGQALHVANVGDSGFIILRHGAVYKRSSPMHHVFSLPVQIERGDDPSSLAQLYKVELEEEDIIVTATDGLLDNLYDQEISLIATKSLANNKTPKDIAELLAKRAQEVGSSASARTPFADDAQAAGFPGHTGGNLDDVAVIVSVVQRR